MKIEHLSVPRREETAPPDLSPLSAASDAQARITAAMREILDALGERPGREGLIDTPTRVASMYLETLGGLYEDPRTPLRTQFSTDRHEGCVILRDIAVHSMCEHHLLPFFGRASVAYLPEEGRIAGLSKIARCVEILAKRPQLQERLTAQVADALEEVLTPRAVLVRVEAEHMCLSMRGSHAHGARMVTICARGTWRDDTAARAEILAQL